MKHTDTKPIKSFGWLRSVLAIFSFGLFAILSLGFTLFYNYCNTDIVLYASVLPDAVKILIDLTEIAIYAICFSILLFSAFHVHEGAPGLSLVWIFLSAVLFRRACDLLGVWLLYGSLDSLDLTYAIVYVLLDTALTLAAFFLARSKANRYYKKMALTAKANLLFKDASPKLSVDALYPFRKIVDIKNHLQAHVAALSVILAVIKVITRILYDVDYGAPADFAEVMIMAVYYLSDLFLAVIFYVLSILVLNQLFRYTEKKNAVKKEKADEVN
ncbi:MAG: hypothetical protein IJY47_03375 [Clostridia bacterium]|nr:hypothetical protein [Clostridia bacterium]